MMQGDTHGAVWRRLNRNVRSAWLVREPRSGRGSQCRQSHEATSARRPNSKLCSTCRRRETVGPRHATSRRLGGSSERRGAVRARTARGGHVRASGGQRLERCSSQRRQQMAPRACDVSCWRWLAAPVAFTPATERPSSSASTSRTTVSTCGARAAGTRWRGARPSETPGCTTARRRRRRGSAWLSSSPTRRRRCAASPRSVLSDGGSPQEPPWAAPVAFGCYSRRWARRGAERALR